MIKLQQFTFVCSPHPVQWAGSRHGTSTSRTVAEYKAKRDYMVRELGGTITAHGAFYLFLKPRGNATEFVKRAIERNLLIIPGNVFSQHDSHFRISYAAEDRTLERGVEVLESGVRIVPPQQQRPGRSRASGSLENSAAHSATTWLRVVPPAAAGLRASPASHARFPARSCSCTTLVRAATMSMESVRMATSDEATR
ncbi:MAG: aminotransferase class I/II-fold pyridoxal phosphate-dependent enzyme [Planctomycetaceae bacterium]